MRPDCVMVTAPTLNDVLRFLQRVEVFNVEPFVRRASIQAFDIAVVPGTPGSIWAVLAPPAQACSGATWTAKVVQ